MEGLKRRRPVRWMAVLAFVFVVGSVIAYRVASTSGLKQEVEAIRNWRGPKTDPTKTGGASGKAGKANRASVQRGGADYGM